MDNIKNTMKTEKHDESIKELFREMVSDEFYNIWADTFEIDCSGEKQIIITYDGIEDIKKFKNECKKTLVSCIYSIHIRRLYDRTYP